MRGAIAVLAVAMLASASATNLRSMSKAMQTIQEVSGGRRRAPARPAPSPSAAA